jgi:hypothetical protein
MKARKYGRMTSGKVTTSGKDVRKGTVRQERYVRKKIEQRETHERMTSGKVIRITADTNTLQKQRAQ